MKIVFLILAHNDLDQLIRFCVKLVDYGCLYIHIDKKTDNEFVSQLSEFIYSMSMSNNIKIIDNRVNVTWGGFSQVCALKNILEVALDENEQRYDRLFIFPGLCYPLYSPKKMNAYCEKNRDIEMIMTYNISRGNNISQKQRVTLYHFFRDINLPHNSFIRRAIIGGSKLLLKYLNIRKKDFLIINQRRWDVYGSSEWIGLTNDCCRYVLSQLRYNKILVRYFKTSYAPDELVVATIVMNSKYRCKSSFTESYDFERLSMLHYLHYTNHIWIYNEQDYDVLIKSEKPFVRKLVSGKSENLIELINNYHGQETHNIKMLSW